MVLSSLVVAWVAAAAGEVEAPSPPPLVEVAPPRTRGRLRASLGLTGVGGVTVQDVVGGGGLLLELGSIRNDTFSVSALVTVATTVVSRTVLSAGPQFSWSFGDHFTLGGGPTVLAAWAVVPGSPFGLFFDPFSLSVGATARAEVAFASRPSGSIRRSSPTVAAFVTVGVRFLGLPGSADFPQQLSLVGGAALCWTWW